MATTPNNRQRQQQQQQPAENITVYFDIETMQVVDEDGQLRRHLPNLLVAAAQDGDLQTWYGPGCIASFIAWLDVLQGYTNDDEFDNDEEDDPQIKITVLAHNIQGYDRYFLLQEYQLQARNYNQFRNEGKIIKLRVGKLGKERVIPCRLPTSHPLSGLTTTL